MFKYSVATDFRLLSLEKIALDFEDFQQASQAASQISTEVLQWQGYINNLGLLGLERWLSERLTTQAISHYLEYSHLPHLQVDNFKLGVISTENVLDELVDIPQAAITNVAEAAHFYVVTEVLEESEEVIIRGFLSYEQILSFSHTLQDGFYHIPLLAFDAELNHLLSYCRLLEPRNISVPNVASETILTGWQSSRTKLSQWLEEIFTEGWQAIDTLLTPEYSLAFNTRSIDLGMQRGKLIDLGMQLGNETVALLVNLTAPDDKLNILLQLHPTGGKQFLPANLKLSLLSKAGKLLQEVQTRKQDNYIQLKPFKGEVGKCFSVEVSWGDVSIKEDFEM